MFRKEVPALHH